MINEQNNLETITLGGGCFWCLEPIFKSLKGVVSVESGYSGGTKENPSYYDVAREISGGHAEVNQVEFDPTIISLEQLLEIFFKMHDPTTLNRQGYDVGAHYRSVIFYRNEKQRLTAEKVLKEIADSHYYSDPIVTEIAPFNSFFKAESFNQNFYEKNQNRPYCRIIIDPKIKKFQKTYSQLLKEE